MDELALAEKIELARIEHHASWDYHSRASIAHRYVAMTVPKVACTTIKMALQTWEECDAEPERFGDVNAVWAGARYWRTQRRRSLRCCDRRTTCVSASSATHTADWCPRGVEMVSSDPQYNHLRASIRGACGYPVVDGERSGPIVFRYAVECMLDNQGAFDFDEHWARQVDLLIANVIDYHVVGRFERFGQEFPAIRAGSAPQPR